MLQDGLLVEEEHAGVGQHRGAPHGVRIHHHPHLLRDIDELHTLQQVLAHALDGFPIQVEADLGRGREGGGGGAGGG